MSDETISKTSSEASLVKIDLEIKQPEEIKETKSEKMERDSIKCSKITFSICKTCIGCLRCCLLCELQVFTVCGFHCLLKNFQLHSCGWIVCHKGHA